MERRKIKRKKGTVYRKERKNGRKGGREAGRLEKKEVRNVGRNVCMQLCVTVKRSTRLIGFFLSNYISNYSFLQFNGFCTGMTKYPLIFDYLNSFIRLLKKLPKNQKTNMWV